MKREEIKKSNDLVFIIDLFIRYAILAAAPLGGLFIFYYLFTPITVYSSYYILKTLYFVILTGNSLCLEGYTIELIDSCIAGSAYYFLLILNLSTGKIKIMNRIAGILFSFVLFFAVNVLRIVVFTIAIVEGYAFFDFTHLFFWYFASTVIVLLIWLIEVKTFKIEGIPILSDLKNIFHMIKKPKPRKIVVKGV